MFVYILVLNKLFEHFRGFHTLSFKWVISFLRKLRAQAPKIAKSFYNVCRYFGFIKYIRHHDPDEYLWPLNKLPFDKKLFGLRNSKLRSVLTFITFSKEFTNSYFGCLEGSFLSCLTQNCAGFNNLTCTISYKILIKNCKLYALWNYLYLLLNASITSIREISITVERKFYNLFTVDFLYNIIVKFFWLRA